MAVNETTVGVPPEEVFALFADGKLYADWVVGAKRIRSVDPTWPQVGSKLYHTVGVGPIEVKDNTQVLELAEPETIVLLARFRPIGRAQVELTVTSGSEAGSSRVRMTEELVRAPKWLKKLLDPTIHARNAEALRRLRELLEEQPDG
ncbi:MAG: SRPBCC family protein [Acidimicrobiales bacterium]